LSEPGHKPVFFIDAEREGPDLLNFLRNIVEQCVPPVTYHTLAETGHYAGVVNFFGGTKIYYRKNMFDQLLEEILDYANEMQTESAQTLKKSVQGPERSLTRIQLLEMSV
jgi:hypothetical protein